MINLMPPALKTEIIYARRNNKLLRWLSAVVVTIVGVGLVIAFGQLYMRRAIVSYSLQVQKAQEQLKEQKLEETQVKLESISSNIKLVVQVLQREIMFSKLIQQLGASIPEGVALSDLQIDKVQGGLALRAVARDFESATQLQINLSDPNNKIFENADIENISCNQAESNPRYPCVVQIRALFTQDNPFLFINSSKTTTGGTN